MNNKSLESDSLRPIRHLYGECTSITRTDDEGWDLLLELMFDVSLEGFPLTPPVRSSKSVWEVAAKVLRKTGANALFAVGVAAHPVKDVGRDFLSVELPEILTGRDNVDINDAVRLYTEAMFCALKVLKKEYLPPMHALSVVKFASDLEKLVHQAARTGGRRPLLEALNTSLELQDFFVELLRGVENVHFSGPGSEVVLQFPFLVKDILSLVQETEAHTVMNYLGIRLIAETSPFLPHTEIVDFKSTLLYGKRQRDMLRWQLCVRTAEKALSPLVLVSVLEEFKVIASPALLSSVTLELFQGILHEINTSSYFDADSEQAARGFLSTTNLRILRPDWINDAALLKHYILGLPPTANRSGLQYFVESQEHTLLASLVRSSSQRWARSVFTTNCWTELTPPTIYVPLLTFNITHGYGGSVDEEQLFSRAGPRLTECILDLIFDHAAATTNNSQPWLSKQSKARLLSAEMCIIGDYAGQPMPQYRRMRDFLAVHFAYALFRKRTRGKAETLRIGGDKVLSKHQLFFVNIMLEACEMKAQLGRTRSKAGQDWITALRNANDFADAYGCRLGSPMNAKNKCVL
ncbi:endothelin-converting enzyme 1-like [Dermacentor andersoni]|uniref:endothelin-converting enzyme 1-like n=1 Tax=Dermacentor andersoni TaxID=34620 RepID=UPI002155005B|nr:endothelin-converting enzyme 1-like [Dermacentor andersoni]